MASERLNAFLKKLDDMETTTRGSESSGASATSKNVRVNNSRAAAFLKKLGIDEEYTVPVDESDIEPFRTDVQELRKTVQSAQLPSQVQKNQQRYDQLKETGGYLEAYANPLDVGTRKNVFQGNYTLQNLREKMDLQQAAMGAYEDDMSYVKDNTQSYEDYTRFVQAAMGDEYKALRGDLYTYGMEKSDTVPEGKMTLDEINSEINALVKEITDAKSKKTSVFDPMMSGMAMPSAPVDVSAQEARLKELYEKLESKDYLTNEEAEAAQQSYFDMYREKWGEQMDTLDEQIAEIEDTLRRGYTTDASKPLTSEEYDALLKKQEELQKSMDEMPDPLEEAYDYGADEYNITETAGKSVEELIEEKYPGQKTQEQQDGTALAEAAAQENAKLEAEIKQLQAYEGNDGWVADLYYGSKKKEGITQRERQIEANERIIRDVEFFQLQSAEDFAKVAEEGKKKIKVLPGAKTIGQYTMRDGKATIDATWNVLTEGEQNTYAYLLETDPEKATEYWKTLTDDTYGVVPKRKTETMQETVTKFAGQNALTATAATAGRILTAPIRTLWGGGSQIADAITGKEISPYSNAMTMTNYAQSTSEGVQQSIDEATAKSPLLNTLATVGYTAFTSMGDSLMAGLFGPLGLPMMGLDSAQQTVNDALENGATQEEAMTLGGVTGIIEVVTEKIPFDELLGALKGKATTGADTLRSAIKKIFVKSTGASATDAAGEMLAEWLENTADRLVMGDKSQRERSIQEFLSTHPFATRETAEKEVIKNEWKQIAIAGLSGAISSGLSTTGGGLVNYGIQRKAEKATANAETEAKANGAYNDEQAQKEYADAVAQHFSESLGTTGETQLEGTIPQIDETTVKNENQRLNEERAAELTGEDTAYEYGLTGRSQEELQNTLEESGIEMTDAARVSFTKGETQRKQNVQKQVEYIKSLNKGGPNGSRKGTFRSISDAELEMFKDRGIRAFSGVFSDKQRAVSNALRGLAETMHMNIVYFESPTDENGNRVGANGFYDRRSNTIYLDVFAGKGNEQAMMRAAAHEVTHVIKEWSPEQYTKLQDKLIKYYYSTGKNTLNEMIQAQKEKAKANGLELTESEALDEVTADACEMMFSDVDAMSEIARTDRTLFEKIGEWINKFVDSIKTAMQGIRSSTKESRLLMESKETWENARKIWYQALEEVGQNNPGSDTETVETVDQTAEIAENVQKPVIKKADSVIESVNRQKKSSKGVAYTADQKPIDYHYELVNADDLIASNTTAFEVNEAYPQELQPRDRQRQASRDQVWNMARNLNPVRLGESVDVQNGAPIIGSDRVVESGNGRVLAVQLAMKYGEKSAKNYTKWLRENAASFGLDAGSVNDNSVLVRVRDSEVDRTQFVKDANESTMASYSESESAQSDSEKMTPEMLELFVPSETGRLDTRENHAFVTRFLDKVIPRNERASYVQQDGSISQRGWTRLRNAVFQRAYGSSQLTGALSEATEDGTKNVIRAMTNAAPHMVLTQEGVKKQQLYDVKLPEAMTEAARRYMQLKREGMDVGVYLSQMKMPGLEEESAGAQALMRMFDKYKGSTNQLTQALNTVMDVLEEYGEPNQVSMFGERVAPELADIVSQAQQRMDNGRVQYSLREADAPTQEDVEKLRSIGKKSINAFTDAEVQQTEAWARKFWGELKEKSPFFRRWFGDWRAYDRTEIPIVKMDDSAEIKSGKETNVDSGIVMSWSKDLVNDSVRHAPKTKKDAVRIASNNIREIVRESVLLDTHVSETGKSSKLPGTAFMHSLYTLVSMDDKKVLMKLYAEQALNQKTGEIFTRAYNVHYIEKVAEFENGVHSISGGLTLSHSTTDISVAELYEIVKQYDENFKPATVNRSMLNEDGTPKAAYHGTPSYGFTVFDKNLMGKGIDQFGAGFYFATDKNAAEHYGDKQYEVYLNIKKPIKIERSLDGGDLFEVEITPQQAYQILKRRPGIMDSEESPLGDYIEEYWSEGPKEWMIREMAKNFSTIGDLDSDRSAFREYPNELHEAIRDVMGYDGVEVSFDNTKEKFYVAWFPEQIKSATDNIGTFDASNPDIRYSQRDTEYKTDRQLLASALEGVTKNAEEAQMLREYQDIAAKLDADERRVQEINKRIRELRLEDVNTPEEQQLLEERKGLEKGITTADRRLFQMERLQPLQRIAKIQRREAEEALQKARRHLERYKEGVIQREYIGKIKRTSDKLAKWLTKPNNQRYVPEDLRKPLAEFLLAIDRGSETMLTGGGMTKADRDYARVVADLRDVVSNISAYQNDQSESGKNYSMYIDLPRGFVEMMTEHARKMDAKTKELGGRMTLNRMNAQELEELFMTLTAISSSITHTNDFLSTENAKRVGEVAQDTIGYLREQKPIVTESKIGEFLNWDNLQPVYAFERYGEGGRQIFRMLQDGQSKLAFNTQEIVKEAEKLYTAKEAKAWSEDIKTFTIGGKEVRIPVANIMSLYCLMRRQQGIGHLYGEGIRVGDFKDGAKTVRDDGHNIGDADIARMVGSLTERQKDVAEKLQQVMSTKGSRWGNEISMKRFGYRMFTEKNYFPIEVDRTHLPARTDNGRGNELYRLLNISSTKPITRGANNRIMLNNIFDVFSSHMSDMAQYNAMALPVLDAVKWLNYKESEMEEVPLGEEKEYRQKYTESVRDAARDAYGYAANKYIVGVLRDINGAQMTGGEGYGKMMLGRVNRASVAANLRVAFLQPLSIIRAATVLKGTDILTGAGIGATHIKRNLKEMEEHSGIAVWKQLGFYDVNIGRSVSKLIKHDETKMDKLIDASMKGAEWADRMTWALMWEGARRDVARTTSPSSEGFLDKVAERFEEVVYKTQVVDSVLTRSQYMRNPGFFAKWTSSFMSEPTTTYNMLLNAYSKFTQEARNTNFQKAWQKTGKMVFRTMAVYTVTAAINAVVESLMGAWRDEDDYKTFVEKFQEGYYDNFVNNIMPFNKLPLISDVYEYAKKSLALFGVDTYGYGDTNVITQWLDQLYAGLEIVADKVNGDSTNYTEYGAIYKLMQGVSSLTGVPMASFMREVAAMWNNTGGVMTGRKIVVYKTSKSQGYQQMYNAIMDENTERTEQIRTELKENGAEDKNIISGLRSLAKQDYMDGNLTDDEAAAFLQKHCGMSADEAYWKLDEWAWDAEAAAEDYSVYNELEEALLTGTGISEAVKRLTDHGYEKSKVQSKVREMVKAGYLSGDLTQTKVTSLLKAYGGLTDNEAYFKQQQYEYERLTGDSTSSDACMIFYQIDNKRSPANAIDAAIKHGKTKSGLASSLTSRYKPQYLEMLKTNKSAAYQLATRLAGIFDYLGYEGTKKVQGWTETK